MPFYRFYGLDCFGNIISGATAQCRGDTDAYEEAGRFLAREACIEVWRGGECLGIIKAAESPPGWTGPHVPLHLDGVEDWTYSVPSSGRGSIGDRHAQDSSPPPLSDAVPGPAPA